MSFKIRTDYDNLNKLYELNKYYNSPRIAKNFSSRVNKVPKILTLQRINEYRNDPAYVNLFRKNITKTPSKSLYSLPNTDRNKTKSLFYSTNRDNYTKSKRTHNYSCDNFNINNYKNKYRFPDNSKNLNFSFAVPENNDEKNLKINKVITASPSVYSILDNIDNIKNNNNEVIEDKPEKDYLLNNKHKMSYLLSRRYKKYKINRKKNPFTINPVNNINVVNRDNNYNKTLRDNSNKSIASIPVRTLNKSIDERYTNRCIDNNISFITDNNNYSSKRRNRTVNRMRPSIDDKYNRIQDYIHLNNLSSLNNSSYNFYNNDIEIKLDDLLSLENRLYNIINILNKSENIFLVNTTNECIEFFELYFNSSLRNKFAYFFGEQNFIIIQTAFNLILFMNIISFHLSLNPPMFSKTIFIIRNIFDKLKIIFYLFVKRIQLYYGDAFCRKNEPYFIKFNKFLIRKGFFDINEKEIIDIISRNSVFIVNQLSNILNYYKAINNNYFNDFSNIYFSLSKMSEEEIRDFFYNNLLNSTNEEVNNSSNYIFDTTYDINSNDINKSNNNIIENYMEEDEEEQYLNEIVLSYKKYRAIPPFIRTKSKKKYTLVLDLGGTIIHIKLDKEGNALCRWRPGIIAFLEAIKPYYEIIAFTKLSKQYSELIIGQIEKKKKYFDYNLSREHCSLVNNKFVKDISKIGRDMKKILIVDDVQKNLEYNEDNGILILPYDADDENEDRVLYELKKLLLMFYKIGYDDLRLAIKHYRNEIYNKITFGNAIE